jgi:hypothetical protein
MRNKEPKIGTTDSQSGIDIRDNSRKGKLPCGARYCHRCLEECGVIVNAYILRDLANESTDD